MASGITLKRVLLSSLLSLGMVCAGCDTFFTFDATVTACDSGLPLEGVAVVTHLDDGIGEEDHRATTDAAGRVTVGLNEPDSVVVTVTLAKAGYEQWSRQYHGAPKMRIEICLTPSPP